MVPNCNSQMFIIQTIEAFLWGEESTRYLAWLARDTFHCETLAEYYYV